MEKHTVRHTFSLLFILYNANCPLAYAWWWTCNCKLIRKGIATELVHFTTLENNCDASYTYSAPFVYVRRRDSLLVFLINICYLQRGLRTRQYERERILVRLQRKHLNNKQFSWYSTISECAPCGKQPSNTQ